MKLHLRDTWHQLSYGIGITVLPVTQHKWTHTHLNHSQTGQCSIHPPLRDGRLSWVDLGDIVRWFTCLLTVITRARCTATLLVETNVVVVVVVMTSPSGSAYKGRLSHANHIWNQRDNTTPFRQLSTVLLDKIIQMLKSHNWEQFTYSACKFFSCFNMKCRVRRHTGRHVSQSFR